MKRFIALSVFILTFFSYTTIIQAESFIKRVSIKLTGGYGSMVVGDLNIVNEDIDSIYTFYSSQWGVTKEGELKTLNVGAEYEVEFVINLTEKFGIGVGIGYIPRKERSRIKFEAQDEYSQVNAAFSLKSEINAIPIKLSAYYFHPINSKVKIYLNGGVGFYLGRSKYLDRESWGYYSYYNGLWVGEEGWVEQEVELKDNALGFQGGIGFELSVIKNMALFAEGAGRYAKLNDWNGEGIITDSYGESEIITGTLWYLVRHDSDFGDYSSFALEEEKSEIEYTVKKLRKADVNFSGFSFRVGIRIVF